MTRLPVRWRPGARSKPLPSHAHPRTMAESRAPRRFRLASAIGILGGGQLGRMLALAAAKLGLRIHIYCPDPDSPAFRSPACARSQPMRTTSALAAFARSVDLVTYEFENVPADTAAVLLARHVHCRASALGTGHHPGSATPRNPSSASRVLNVADFEAVRPRTELQAAAAPDIGYPCGLKTRRFGYDGKGQSADFRTHRHSLPLGRLWAQRPPSSKSLVPFTKELSVILARGADGTFVSSMSRKTGMRHHILRSSTVPAASARRPRCRPRARVRPGGSLGLHRSSGR